MDDTNTGGSTITNGYMTIGYQEWNSSLSMTPDTSLNSPFETFTLPIDFSDWVAGTHDIFMYGMWKYRKADGAKRAEYQELLKKIK